MLHAASSVVRSSVLVSSLACTAFLGAGACLAQAPSSVQPLPDGIRTTAAGLRDSALRGTQAYEFVRSLTTEVGPRLAGSDGDRRGVEWGVRKLKELGFSNVRAEKVTVPHWVRGSESGEILTPFPQPVALTALGGSVGTPEAGIEGEVVEVARLEDLDKLAPDAVRGKILFISNRMERTQDGSGYGRAVGARSAGPSRAGELGAIALLIRSISTSDDRLPHTGATRYEEGGPRIPAAALSNPDADLLAAKIAASKGTPVRFRLKLGAQYLPEAESANVIGEIPGREKPEEIVLLGCHLDSWDLGTGAIDDATGCAIVSEAARLIGQLQQRPRRTIRVVLYANEEFGLSGARGYAEKYAADLPKHIIAAESDFGTGRIWQISSRVDPATRPRVEQIAELLKPLDIALGGNEAGGGADLIPLAPARVPVVSLNQDGTTYFDYHHTANDTLDKVDVKALDQNVAAWAVFAYVAAEMEGDFGRGPEQTGR